ncbi:MAG TPA: N-6 DNA methylase [Gemmatimonadaceae bacterium]
MRTLRAAAELLAGAHDLESLGAIASCAGCDGAPQPLDARTRAALGLPDAVTAANVASGRGALRAMLLTISGDANVRDVLPRVASRLSSRAPHLLWLVVVVNPERGDLALAAWTDDRRPPRVSALLANRNAIVDSDADTLRALASTPAATGRDILVHTRWVEILGRESLTNRFYRALEQSVDTIARSSVVGSASARREIALLNTSRLLFLSFLEAKGWLDGDSGFLSRQFDETMARGGRFHDRVLRPLFFGTLNTPPRLRAAAANRFGNIPFLNGGLFARSPIERRHRGLAFTDDAYGVLIGSVLGQFRFTAREETARWSEAAVDPEMLGRAFESLMAAPERRRTGAFYTPFALVERVTNAGLDAAVTSRDADPADVLRSLTVLDPACGSGAFLVHLLERITHLLRLLGDTRDVSTVRREVLTRSIFGVDVNPTAVWLCELRLWLSVVIESEETNPRSVTPLPNLDRNIRTGDTLAARPFGDGDINLRGTAALYRLRKRYSGASGARKESLGRELDRVERKRGLDSLARELESIAAQRRDLVAARRGRDLFGGRYEPSRDERIAAEDLRRRAAALRAARNRIAAGGALPFSFPVHFAEVAARGGFGLVVGNPPWVRMHNVSPKQRLEFRRDFFVARNAAWEAGSAHSGAGRAFAAQVDVAALFVERSLQLAAPSATIALLLPVKLWQSLAGGGVRRLIAESARLVRVDDLSEAAAAFDAAVYPSLIVAQRVDPTHGTGNSPKDPVRMAVHRRGAVGLEWTSPVASLPFDSSRGAPWILLPRDARRAFDLLRTIGEPLATSVFGRPLLGIKCGCNDAFVVKLEAVRGDLARVMTSDGRSIELEYAMLRPLLRGEQLEPWNARPGADHVIWTMGADGSPLGTLPPLTARWLARWRRRLDARTDAKHRARWWTLFRTDGAAHGAPRVVWCDMGRQPRASVLDAGDATVPLNSCYVVRCASADDAHALVALLNGPLARAWLNAIAEPARGGYRRYLGWTMSLLPIPRDWSRARDILAPLGRAARLGVPPADPELFRAALDAYEAEHDDLAALVAWMSC